MKNIVLDTNAYTGFLTGQKEILDYLGEAENVYMSVVVMGELYAGFRGGTKEKENKNLLKKFLDKPTVQILSVTQETAEIFGEIKNHLKSAGKPIPINDIWIAAHCLETGSVLITYDRHFENIPSVRQLP